MKGIAALATAKIDGRRWTYDLTGPEGAPLVALANGVLADARGWAPQVAVLSKRYRVLTFDFPGQGRSEALERPVRVSEQAQGASALLEEVGGARVHWIGISYGGEVGLTLAAHRPERFESLIVADSVASIDTTLAWRVEAWLAAAKTGDPDLLYRVAVPDIFSAGYIEAHAQAMEVVRTGFHALNLTSVVHLLARYGDYDVTAQLEEIRVPTLLLCGELDTIKPPFAMKAMADRMPTSEYFSVPGAGHALPIEKPNEFMTASLGFLAKRGRER